MKLNKISKSVLLVIPAWVAFSATLNSANAFDLPFSVGDQIPACGIEMGDIKTIESGMIAGDIVVSSREAEGDVADHHNAYSVDFAYYDRANRVQCFSVNGLVVESLKDITVAGYDPKKGRLFSLKGNVGEYNEETSNYDDHSITLFLRLNRVKNQLVVETVTDQSVPSRQ